MPRVEVYLDEELVRAIEDYAQRHNTNKSTVVRVLVEKYLNQLDPEDFELQLRYYYFRVAKLRAMLRMLRSMSRTLEKLEEEAQRYPIEFKNAYLKLVRELKRTLDEARERLKELAGDQDVRGIHGDSEVEPVPEG